MLESGPKSVGRFLFKRLIQMLQVAWGEGRGGGGGRRRGGGRGYVKE